MFYFNSYLSFNATDEIPAALAKLLNLPPRLGDIKKVDHDGIYLIISKAIARWIEQITSGRSNAEIVRELLLCETFEDVLSIFPPRDIPLRRKVF